MYLCRPDGLINICQVSISAMKQNMQSKGTESGEGWYFDEVIKQVFSSEVTFEWKSEWSVGATRRAIAYSSGRQTH